MLLPGRIHTKRIDELDQTVAKNTGQTLESVRKASRATIPVGRYGKVEEFADTAAFICSDRAGYITCLLYTSPSPRDRTRSRMPSSA